MEYFEEGACPNADNMKPVHHILDDSSECFIDDPRLDDEPSDCHTDEPQVITWFTFYSHRAQREYYYEPISGTTTWIAPSQTTDEAPSVISRLPGSPIQDTMANAAHMYQKQVLPIITKRPVAVFLLFCNILLFSAVWWMLRNGVTLLDEAFVQQHLSYFSSSKSNMMFSSTNDSLENAMPNDILDVDLIPDKDPETLEVAVDDEIASPPEESELDSSFYYTEEPKNMMDESLIDATTWPDLSDISIPPDETANDDETTGLLSSDSVPETYDPVVEEPMNNLEDKELHLDEKDEIHDSAPQIDDEMSKDVFVEVEVPQTSELESEAAFTKGKPSTVNSDVTNGDALLTESIPIESDINNVFDMKENEGPVIAVIEHESVIGDDNFDAEKLDAPDSIVEFDFEEKLHQIQKEGDSVVQRVALVATEAGYHIELEPNLTGFTHSPLEVLMQQGVAA